MAHAAAPAGLAAAPAPGSSRPGGCADVRDRGTARAARRPAAVARGPGGDERGARASRAGRRRASISTRRRARDPAARARRPGRRAAAARERGRRRCASSPTASSTTIARCGAGWSGAGTRSAPARTSRCSCTCTRSAGPAFVEGLRGMFALALWDARAPAARARARPVRDQAARLRAARRPARVRVRAEGAARAAGVPARDRPGRGRALPRAERGARARRRSSAPRASWSPGTGSSSTPRACRLERYARPRPVPAGEERRESLAALARGGARAARGLRARASAGRRARRRAALGRRSTPGLVTALARRRRLKTFSVGFDVAAFDELAGARAVAERYGTDHHELRLGPEAALELEGVAATLRRAVGRRHRAAVLAAGAVRRRAT